MFDESAPILPVEADRTIAVASRMLVVFSPDAVAPPPTERERELDGLARLVHEWGELTE